jgi:hypothetical protein
MLSSLANTDIEIENDINDYEIIGSHNIIIINPNRKIIEIRNSQPPSSDQITSNIREDTDWGNVGYKSGSAASQMDKSWFQETRSLTLSEIKRRFDEAIKRDEQRRKELQESEERTICE